MKNKRKKMKNKKGFTLIELLAVITIMGILMLVAIPAVSRTIENSRREIFKDTALAYINAVKNAIAADELYSSDNKPISSLNAGYYYYGFKSEEDSGEKLIEQGGKSSWGNAEVIGYVAIHKNVDTDKVTYEYAITMTDGNHGIKNLTKESDLTRTSVLTKNALRGRQQPTGSNTGDDKDKFGSDKISTISAAGIFKAYPLVIR